MRPAGSFSAAAPVGAEPTSTGRCAPCGQRMIFVDLQSAPIITGEARLPLRWLCQLPHCGLAARKSFRKPIPFSKLKLYNSASDKSEYGCERIAIQTGETLNGLFFHEKLFDHVDLVVAPVLIGGRNTSTLIDGKSLFSQRELSKKVF